MAPVDVNVHSEIEEPFGFIFLRYTTLLSCLIKNINILPSINLANLINLALNVVERY
ncbi:hypothetical protein D3C75_724530 [compost metagenome]